MIFSRANAGVRSGRGTILRGLWCLALVCLVPRLDAAETLPAPPPRHFNDFAGVVPTTTAQQLDQELDQFERNTSNQLVVAIYPHLDSASPIEDYSVRLYQKWGLGVKGRDNGALLLIYTQDHKMRIATGYGLEGALPDAICKRILDDEIAPRLRAGDFGGGVTAGVHAMMAAAKGEYRGSGRTVHDSKSSAAHVSGFLPFIIFGVFVLLTIISNKRQRGRHVYGRSGRGIMYDPPFWGGSGGGGWSGGGGGFSGGGGGFSGGGGSTGGGGASGSW